MQKAPDMIGKENVRCHVVWDKEIDEAIINEANKTAAGNVSFVLRKILRKYYKLKS